jgi:hypothetical protein
MLPVCESWALLFDESSYRSVIHRSVKQQCGCSEDCYHVRLTLYSALLRTITFKKVITSVALYGCETPSLTRREEHRVRVFENRG